jgi:hypothetical protein
MRMRTKIINMLESGADSNTLMSNLKRTVTIRRTLKMDQHQYRLMSKSQMTQETIGINGSDETKKK